MMAALMRAGVRKRLSGTLLVRGGYDSFCHTSKSGVDVAVVKPTHTGLISTELREEVMQKKGFDTNWSGIEKNSTSHLQHPGRGITLMSSFLHTLANTGSAHPCCNSSIWWKSKIGGFVKPLAVGGVRHESVYEKKMQEIKLVRARQRRVKRAALLDGAHIPSNSNDAHTPSYSNYNEDPTQPPLSQPLVGSLVPTCPEEELLAPVLARPDLLITRNVEWANLAFGFEQQNRYVIMDPRQPQAPVGYILEDSNILLRQVMRTRRPFVASILDGHSNEVFRVRRPAWLINSSIFVEVDGKVIGECHRRWHLWRRIYDIYLGNKQFAVVENPGFWHWTFSLKDKDGGTLAEIDRNWRGFGYEFLTDAGQYMIRFGDVLPEGSDHFTAPVEVMHSRGPLLASTKGQSGVQEMQQLKAAAEEAEPLSVVRSLTISERAVALALAISLDNDYFSRHSHPGLGIPLPFIGSEATST